MSVASAKPFKPFKQCFQIRIFRQILRNRPDRSVFHHLIEGGRIIRVAGGEKDRRKYIRQIPGCGENFVLLLIAVPVKRDGVRGKTEFFLQKCRKAVRILATGHGINIPIPERDFDSFTLAGTGRAGWKPRKQQGCRQREAAGANLHSFIHGHSPLERIQSGRRSGRCWAYGR